MARALLLHHVDRRPDVNPVERFRHRFERDLGWIQEHGLGFYHVWAFATVRQLGAAMELLELHLKWLVEAGQGEGLAPAAEEFQRLSASAKTFVLKAALAVNTLRALDASGSFDEMAQAWDRGIAIVSPARGAPAEHPP